MYSLVVMAALTTGVETPDCWFRCGCSGYHGCGGCYGCWGCGGCYGGYGSWYGCHGCWGGGYSSYSGCHGCSGYGGYNGCYGCWGCYGCYGYSGYSGYAPMYGPGPVMPTAPAELGTPKKTGTSLSPDRAKLQVELPANAKLFIDDQPIKMTGTAKTFNTPALERGQSYYYILKVEVALDGVTHSETRRVVIRAGDEVSARFTEQSVVAAARASAAAR
jgi:uncharacterized protein (TIGR03000 family)